MPLYFTKTTQSVPGASQNFKFMHRYSSKIVLRRDAIKKDGTAPLVLQVFINGERVVVPIGISIAPKHWDDENRRVKLPRSQKQWETDYNMLIMKAEAKVSQIFIQHRANDIVLTKKQFKKSYLQSDTNMNFKTGITDGHAYECRLMQNGQIGHD